MHNENVLKFDVSFKSISMLLILGLLPNILGMLNIPTVMGFKIHVFQYVVFIAAALYGPVGGVVSGGLGSMFTAVALSNPYIAVGNMILGFMTGFFIKKGFGIIPSVLLAFAIQAPWLYVSDVYLVGMSAKLVVNILMALLFSNVLWAVAAKYSYKSIEKAIK